MAKDKEIELDSEKIKKRDTKIRILKIALLISSLFLIIIYFILRIVYQQGAFTVSLDQNFSKRSGIIIYEKLKEKDSRIMLQAEKLEFIDNISVNWLPNNLNTEAEGSHNGENYIAYTFYVENNGSETINYWYSLVIDDVIRDVDKAIRIMIYQNDEKNIYAKKSSNGGAEPNTEMFYSDSLACVKQRRDFKVNDIDKYTIVIWIEGDDPDCIDALIGGEMKMHLEITEEHI